MRSSATYRKPSLRPWIRLLVSIPIFVTATAIPIGLRPAAHLRPTTVMQAAAQTPPQLAAGDRRRIINAVAASVKKYYFDKQVAETTASALLAHEQAGDYR